MLFYCSEKTLFVLFVIFEFCTVCKIIFCTIDEIDFQQNKIQQEQDTVIKSTKSNLGFDLGKVLVILILITLVNVFKYGAVLQQESDETL